MTRGSTWIVAAAVAAVAAGAIASGRAVAVVSAAQVPALPDAAGRATVQKMCGTACHDFSFLIGRRETADRWGAIVEDMSVRGAPGSRQDIEVVIAYLATHFGRSPSPAAAVPGRPRRWPPRARRQLHRLRRQRQRVVPRT